MSPVLGVELLIGVPSITKSAWFEPVSEEYPRTITLAEPPIVLYDWMSRPAISPLKDSIGFNAFTSWKSSPLSSWTA